MRKWRDDLRLMHMHMGVFWKESCWLVNSLKWEELRPEVMWHNDDIMEKPKDFPKGYKKVKWVAQSTRTTHTMASEVFLAVFCAHFDAHYNTSNESCLRWWINESIWDFIAPTFICGNPLQACTVRHEGHCPKGTVMDYGRILLYLPWLDGSGPRWSRRPQLQAYDGSRAPFQSKAGWRHRMPPPLIILWQCPTMQLGYTRMRCLEWARQQNIRAPSMVSLRWTSISRTYTEADGPWDL